MKKIILIVLSLLNFSNIKSQLPTFEWAKRLGGTSQDQPRSMDVDKYGNTYTLGWFQGTVDLDPGPGTFNVTSNGSFDIFISKLDNNGDFVWAKQIGGSWIDTGYSIEADSLCNIYVGGAFTSTVDFDPGAGVFNLSSTGNFGITNTFILKLNASGDFVWAKQIKGYDPSDGNNVRAIALDQCCNVFIGGLFIGTADFDPSISTYSLTAGGVSNAFVSKLDSGGNFLWVKQFTTDSSVVPVDLELDKKGNIYSTGTFNGTADFDPGIGVHNLISAGGNDIYTLKLNNAGDLVWDKQFGGPLQENPRDIAVDKYGSVYSTGTFGGTADFDPNGIFNLSSSGANDSFLSKLDSLGDFVWAKQLGGINQDAGTAVTIDEQANIYVVGSFADTVDFNLNSGIFNLHTISYSTNSFILKLDSLTNLIWVQQIAGHNNSSQMKMGPNKTIYVAGIFSGSSDFDPSPNIFNLTSSGGNDTYIYKMSQQTTVNLNDGIIVNSITLYPNPTNGILNITETNRNKKINIEIYDSLGTLVIKKAGEDLKLIDLSGLRNGIYFMKIMSDQQLLKTEKILKH